MFYSKNIIYLILWFLLFPPAIFAQRMVAGQTYQLEDRRFQLHFSRDSFLLTVDLGAEVYVAWGAYSQTGADVSFRPAFSVQDAQVCLFKESQDSSLSPNEWHIFIQQYAKTGHAKEQKDKIVVWAPRQPSSFHFIDDYTPQKIGSYSNTYRHLVVRSSWKKDRKVWRYERKNLQNNVLRITAVSLAWRYYFSFDLSHAYLQENTLVFEKVVYTNPFYNASAERLVTASELPYLHKDIWEWKPSQNYSIQKGLDKKEALQRFLEGN